MRKRRRAGERDETERGKGEVETEQTAARLKRTKMERRDTRTRPGSNRDARHKDRGGTNENMKN